MVRQDGTAGIVGLRYANPTYSNYESLYLPSPLLILRLRSGQAKEGNRKTLDPRFRSSIKDVEDKRRGLSIFTHSLTVFAWH